MALGVHLEHLVHDAEHLLHSLIEPQIFSALDQQVVVFFVAAVNRDTLGSADAAQDEDGLAQTGNFHVLAGNRLLVYVFVLAWHLDVLLLVVEVVVVQVLQVQRESGELFFTLAQSVLAYFLLNLS